MSKFKSLEPSGFHGIFYQTLWDTVGIDFINMVKFSCTADYFGSNIFTTLISKDPLLSQFRFDDFTICFYEEVAKLLANRLKPLVEDIISPF